MLNRTTMATDAFGPADREQIAARGTSVEEVQRQLALFAHPPAATRLDRACTPGDGLRVLGEAERTALGAAHDAAAAGGRFLKFVPASGAASRMFKAPLWALGRPEPARRDGLARLAAEGNGDARDLVALMDGLERIGFLPDLAAAVAARGHDLHALLAAGTWGEILAAMLTTDGLDYGARPKGLIPFHRYGDGSRTPVEEHLVEAAAYVRDRDGRCRLHFTVSPQHLDAFRALLARVQPAAERRLGARFEIGFSFQKPSTDTIAADETNGPFRTRDGRLLFRPGGHGALLENLGDLGADLVYVKNVDNVVPERLLAPTAAWKRALGGLLVTLQQRIFALLEDLDRPTPSPAVLDAALAFVTTELLLPAPARADAATLRARLDRPLRVCGMVRNLGDPGGGPFWVRGRDGGVTAQIVETAQVDAGDPGQKALLAAATHFNPVDLVCALRDRRGAPYRLAGFVDRDAVFLSQKSHEGRVLKALEHPGLWNGAMAGWNTVFVEVPSITLNPVKTVNDLLRPEHQPA